MKKKVKLIDANEIHYSDMSDGQVPEGLWYTFKDNIDEMPAVKAIPVEWIENYYKLRFMAKPVEWFEAIEIMLIDWERENA